MWTTVTPGRHTSPSHTSIFTLQTSSAWIGLVLAKHSTTFRLPLKAANQIGVSPSLMGYHLINGETHITSHKSMARVRKDYSHACIHALTHRMHDHQALSLTAWVAFMPDIHNATSKYGTCHTSNLICLVRIGFGLRHQIFDHLEVVVVMGGKTKRSIPKLDVLPFNTQRNTHHVAEVNGTHQEGSFTYTHTRAHSLTTCMITKHHIRLFSHFKPYLVGSDRLWPSPNIRPRPGGLSRRQRAEECAHAPWDII